MNIQTMTMLLAAMCAVESGNNPEAYNAKENAVGILQIRELAVRDINREFGTEYELDDFYNPVLSRWAVLQYGKMWGADCPESFARTWNGGPKGMKKESTIEYWHRVKAIFRENP